MARFLVRTVRCFSLLIIVGIALAGTARASTVAQCLEQLDGLITDTQAATFVGSHADQNQSALLKRLDNARRQLSRERLPNATRKVTAYRKLAQRRIDDGDLDLGEPPIPDLIGGANAVLACIAAIGCPVDDTKIEKGLCGCGIPDTDTDNDGTPDCLDPCPEDPGTIPDEFGFCGDTGDFATVVEGEALTLAVNGAVLTIPADALAPGTTVSLSEIDPALLDELPNSSDETRITPIYALEFSAAQLTRDHVSFALDVPSTLTRLPYTRVQIEGGLATEGQSHTGWLPKIGSYEEAQSLLVIKLGATATRFLITGLTRISATPTAVAASAAGSELRTPDLMQARALAIPAAAFSEEPAWTEHGWIVMCDPDYFEEFNDDRCDVESAAFEAMMEDVASSLYESDQQLTSLLFPRGRVSRMTPAAVGVNFPYLFYDPDLRSVATAGVSGGDPEYFGALVTPDTTTPDTADDVPGAYRADLEFIIVDSDLVPSLRNATTIHELMHAVQRIEIVDVWDDGWIIEGLASAVEPDAPGYSGPRGAEYRYLEEWRDWKYHLTREQGTDQYEVLEFWLSLTGDMSRIPRFYEWIRGIDSNTESNSLLRVDEVLTAMSLPSLREAYTNLILTRDGQTDYPHCADEGLFCSGSSCSTAVEEVHPFSAHCRAEIVEFDRCDDEPAEITVTLEPDSPNPNMKLILGGTIYDANTAVDFPNDGGRLWVINTDLESGFMSPGPTAKLVFKNKAECGNPYISIVRQSIGSGARAVAGSSSTTFPNVLGPGSQFTSQQYQSFEDLITDSTIYTVVSGVGEDTIIVEPLNLDAWETVHNVGASHQYEGGDISIAAASSSASTDTDIVGNSMITTGQQTVTGSVSGANRELTAVAGSSNNYIYSIESVPVELTLDWGCSMSTVLVKITDPMGGFPETLLVARNTLDPSINNWECGTRSWTIPPDYLLSINISSRFDEYRDDSAETYKDSGGGFEINLQPILPDEE